MDGILPLLIVVISILSVISKAQKKKEAEKKKTAVPQAFPAIEAETPPRAAQFDAVQRPRPAPVFQPAPAVMGFEGEDACHDYMLPEQQQEAENIRVQEDGLDEHASRELVRGVILSEILRRPQSRAYGRRRA